MSLASECPISIVRIGEKYLLFAYRFSTKELTLQELINHRLNFEDGSFIDIKLSTKNGLFFTSSKHHKDRVWIQEEVIENESGYSIIKNSVFHAYGVREGGEHTSNFIKIDFNNKRYLNDCYHCFLKELQEKKYLIVNCSMT